MDRKVVERRMREARIHLQFCAEIYEDQLRRGCHFLHENPASAKSWEEQCIKKLMNKPNVQTSVAHMCQYDMKQSIGKRYARMDEAGTPFCITVDHTTLEDQTVTLRHRDSGAQERIALGQVGTFLANCLN